MLKMYSVYDRIAQVFAAPFVLNDKTAQRTFKWMQDEKEKHDLEDKEVHEIAAWDENTGKIVPLAEHVKVYDFDPSEVKKDELP